MATEADRHARGNMIWASWDGRTGKGRRQQPSHGSMMVLFTPAFAREYLPWLQRQKPEHCDLLLRQWFLMDAAKTPDESVGSCFLYPSLGSFESHVSGCEKGIGVRCSTFGQPWVGNGFHDEKGARYLGLPRSSGGPEWICKLDLNAPNLHWVTEAPPTHWHDPVWQQRLWNQLVAGLLGPVGRPEAYSAAGGRVLAAGPSG